ncbi:hypothetical protein IQ260_17300 [Leptolyngbya cf. ectocarpi LEGE 11479]|uniref:Uncharacterized protein n=1 Tax=Leptolyngbya cf. ectocarpi LEGE 11479 TaxID=1828722 RepID=A0A928ZVV7_LEPEC|nr:hypothetical protein [Leptolyngbya ectocarpi]MBE9068411.1 hypothetical protein [Leptolyngbya cf. ectocarpi LEGE 11479]
MSDKRNTSLSAVPIAVVLTVLITAAVSYAVFQSITSRQRVEFERTLSQQRDNFQDELESQQLNTQEQEPIEIQPLPEPGPEPEPESDFLEYPTCDSDIVPDQLSGLEDDFDFRGGAFATYDWLRAEDGKALHSIPVYLITRGNQMCIYQTLSRAPLGSQALCGGLGCDLKPSELISVMGFSNNSNGEIVVDYADGPGSFMRGATCQIDQSYLPVMTCDVPRSPSGTIDGGDGGSMVRFAPAS